MEEQWLVRKPDIQGAMEGFGQATLDVLHLNTDDLLAATIVIRQHLSIDDLL